MIASIDPRASVTAAPSGGVVAPLGGDDFGNLAIGLVRDAIGTIKTAEATASAAVVGTASIQHAVESIMTAERQLQATLAIRDKVVAAYIELSRMAI